VPTQGTRLADSYPACRSPRIHVAYLESEPNIVESNTFNLERDIDGRLRQTELVSAQHAGVRLARSAQTNTPRGLQVQPRFVARAGTHHPPPHRVDFAGRHDPGFRNYPSTTGGLLHECVRGLVDAADLRCRNRHSNTLNCRRAVWPIDYALGRHGLHVPV